MDLDRLARLCSEWRIERLFKSNLVGLRGVLTEFDALPSLHPRRAVVILDPSRTAIGSLAVCGSGIVRWFNCFLGGRMRFKLIVLALVALFAASALASAQSQTGEIFGKVTDESSAVLPGVTVTVTSPVLLQPLTAVTSATGTFQFPRIEIGTYSVKFELPRLQDGRQSGYPGHRSASAPRSTRRWASPPCRDRHGHRREPDRRHQGDRHEADLHQRACCRASRRPATRGSSSSRRPASPWTARTSAATCRASSPTSCRAAPARATPSGRSTASTSPTWRRPARRRTTTTSTRSRK